MFNLLFFLLLHSIHGLAGVGLEVNQWLVISGEVLWEKSKIFKAPSTTFVQVSCGAYDLRLELEENSFQAHLPISCLKEEVGVEVQDIENVPIFSGMFLLDGESKYFHTVAITVPFGDHARWFLRGLCGGISSTLMTKKAVNVALMGLIALSLVLHCASALRKRISKKKNRFTALSSGNAVLGEWSISDQESRWDKIIKVLDRKDVATVVAVLSPSDSK